MEVLEVDLRQEKRFARRRVGEIERERIGTVDRGVAEQRLWGQGPCSLGR